MYHRMADLDAGSEPVDQNATGLALEKRQQFACSRIVRFINMERRGQLAFQIRENRTDSIEVRAFDHKASRTEHFFLKFRFAQEVFRGGREQPRLSLIGAAFLPACNDLIAAIARNRLGELEVAKAHYAQALANWPVELKQSPFATRADGGMLWFDNATELAWLQTAAVVDVGQK